MGTKRPLSERGTAPPPIFGPCLLWPNGGWIKMPLGTKVGLSPGDFVLDGDPAPFLPKRRRSPQFSVHVYCGRTAGWIKMALGMEVGLGPIHIVLDGDTAPLPKKGTKLPPQFSAHLYCGQTAGCIKMPLGMEVGLSPGDFVLDGDPASYPKRGGAPAKFRPTSIVAKRLHGSSCHLVRR